MLIGFSSKGIAERREECSCWGGGRGLCGTHRTIRGIGTNWSFLSIDLVRRSSLLAQKLKLYFLDTA